MLNYCISWVSCLSSTDTDAQLGRVDYGVVFYAKSTLFPSNGGLAPLNPPGYQTQLHAKSFGAI